LRLPGSGKTTVADALAQRARLALLSRDVVEAALLRWGIGREQNSGWAAYDVLVALAGCQLAAGIGVVVDSVAATARVRTAFAEAAARHHAMLLLIECRCRDEALHRSRLGGRTRGIDGWPELDWAEVERVRAAYEPIAAPDLHLDAADPLEVNIEAAVELVVGTSGR
jgi:predicted kinase